jgi:Txe/YoeB family toxin of Txe-Axe toxin-antitoxin module
MKENQSVKSVMLNKPALSNRSEASSVRRTEERRLIYDLKAEIHFMRKREHYTCFYQ